MCIAFFCKPKTASASGFLSRKWGVLQCIHSGVAPALCEDQVGAIKKRLLSTRNCQNVLQDSRSIKTTDLWIKTPKIVRCRKYLVQIIIFWKLIMRLSINRMTHSHKKYILSKPGNNKQTRTYKKIQNSPPKNKVPPKISENFNIPPEEKVVPSFVL